MTAQEKSMAIGIVGDLSDIGRCQTEKDAERQHAWLIDWMKRCEVPLFVCSGNHDIYPHTDWAEWLLAARRPGLSTDGDVVEFAGRRIALAPYAVGPSHFLESLRREPPPDVLFHHEPPSGSLLAIAVQSGSDFGSDDLADAMSSGWCPKVVFSGHVHRPEKHHQFVEDSLCINLAGDPRLSPPAHAILDLCTGVIERYSPRFEGIYQNPDW